MRVRIAALLACLAFPAAAQQTLNVATGGGFTSMDPHYHNYGPNNVLTTYVFDPLVRFEGQYLNGMKTGGTANPPGRK